MFITFEGIDGSGKTTQIHLLREELEKRGQKVVVTREPGGTRLAEAIREYLLHGEQPLHDRAELLLFSAARAQHVAELILPALEAGAYVLCDRFADSTLAYQGGGLGMDRDVILRLNAFATSDLKPHLTFLLDVAPAVGLQRRADERGDRIEKRGEEFQEKVRNAYLEIARAEPQRVVVIDGSLSPEEVHCQILSTLENYQAAQQERSTSQHAPDLKLLKGNASSTRRNRQKSTSFTNSSPAPQSLEAEQSTLGAMMLASEALVRALEIVELNDFYRQVHRTIFDIIVTLFNKGEPVDLMTVVAEAQRRHQLDEVGGAAYLQALIEACPSTSTEDVTGYASTMKEKSVQRGTLK